MLIIPETLTLGSDIRTGYSLEAAQNFLAYT